MPNSFGMFFNELFSTDDVFTDALRKSAATENPTIILDIDLVCVLSGRSGFALDLVYKRDDNFVDLDLLEALKWKNPALEDVNQQNHVHSI